MFLFGFNRYIAPTIIKIIYYLGLVMTVFGGLGLVLYALTEMQTLGVSFSAKMILGAVFGAPVIILFLRFTTELWLVMFEMHDRLAEMREKR
ncbi:MAG: DUF4282 domain-containing protein [Amphiplicatus sp.]